MAIVNSIGTYIGKGIAKATNAKPATWLGEKFEKVPESALAAATVTSIILKDGIGCAMYVTQSLNNKKIPDEKRKFVAALDLTNGVLMIGAQIAMFLAMRKYSGPLFEKLFKKSFNNLSKGEAITRTRMNEALKDPNAVPRKSVVEKEFEKVRKDSLGLFKFVVDIAAATIIGKRVIVPLIATPLAKKVEKKMDEHKKAKANGIKPVAEAQKEEVKSEAKFEESKEKVPNFENNPDSNLLSRYKK